MNTFHSQLFNSNLSKFKTIKLILVLSLLVFLPQQFVYTQSIKLSTLNNGGNSLNTASMNFEWSLGESALVGSFMNGTSIFTFGVLQPMTHVITGFSEIDGTVLGNSIQILPNPTFGPIEIVSNFMQFGTIYYRILNSTSELKIQNRYTVFLNKQVHGLSINQFPSGIYYLNIVFVPQIGTSKMGIFKIVKL